MTFEAGIRETYAFTVSRMSYVGPPIGAIDPTGLDEDDR